MRASAPKSIKRRNEAGGWAWYSQQLAGAATPDVGTARGICEEYLQWDTAPAVNSTRRSFTLDAPVTLVVSGDPGLAETGADGTPTETIGVGSLSGSVVNHSTYNPGGGGGSPGTARHRGAAALVAS